VFFNKYKHIPEFIEAWEESDLDNMVTVFPMVVERKTEKLVGMLIGVLDYYQYWNDEYISRVNVHTAMVRMGYGGKGVFSSLNNFGQATNRAMMGLTYYEGTYIWTKNSKGVNNKKAVNSVFPHCTPIRTHVIFEKKVK
jgi:aspartate ammonia-lyase